MYIFCACFVLFLHLMSDKVFYFPILSWKPSYVSVFLVLACFFVFFPFAPCMTVLKYQSLFLFTDEMRCCEFCTKPIVRDIVHRRWSILYPLRQSYYAAMTALSHFLLLIFLLHFSPKCCNLDSFSSASLLLAQFIYWNCTILLSLYFTDNPILFLTFMYSSNPFPAVLITSQFPLSS